MSYTIFKSIKLINPATNFNQKVNVVLENETIISIGHYTPLWSVKALKNN